MTMEVLRTPHQPREATWKSVYCLVKFYSKVRILSWSDGLITNKFHTKHGSGPPQPVLHWEDDIDPLEHEDGRPEEERKLLRTLNLRPVCDGGERRPEDVVEDDGQGVQLAHGGQAGHGSQQPQVPVSVEVRRW